MNVPSIDNAASIDSWKRLGEFLAQNGLRFAVHLAVAIAIFWIGKSFARWAGRVLRTMILRAKVDETAATFIGDFVTALILVFVGVSALGWIGFDTTSFAAVIAAAGLAIGLALQGSLSNLAAGLVLIIFKPFKVGDTIEIGPSIGTVEDVRVFATSLRTGDNVQITIPNSQITQGVVKNYSAKETRRIDLVVNCSYEDSLPAVKHFLESVLTTDNRILPDPKATVVVGGLGENCLQLAVQPWVRTADYADVRADLSEKIKNGFDEHKFRLGKR